MVTPPPRRIVLLGASNLVRGISTAVGTALLLLDGPLEVLLAAGHGRSYCARSRVLLRSLPGIPQCGLWRALDDGSRRPISALATDIGNDLLYGVPPRAIAVNLAECLDRLQADDARIVVTALPLANLRGLSAARFLFFRSLFFPRCRLSLPEMAAAASELDERVREVAAARGAAVVEHRPEWYGLDPIHLKREMWPAAWREILEPWNPQAKSTSLAKPSVTRWLRIRPRMPEKIWLAGLECARTQPSARLPDGGTIGLY